MQNRAGDIFWSQGQKRFQNPVSAFCRGLKAWKTAFEFKGEICYILQIVFRPNFKKESKDDTPIYQGRDGKDMGAREQI